MRKLHPCRVRPAWPWLCVFRARLAHATGHARRLLSWTQRTGHATKSVMATVSLGSPWLVPKPDVRLSIASGFPANTFASGRLPGLGRTGGAGWQACSNPWCNR